MFRHLDCYVLHGEPADSGHRLHVSLTAANARGTSTTATKAKATTGAKAKRYYIRRYHKGQMDVRGKQIKDIRRPLPPS